MKKIKSTIIITFLILISNSLQAQSILAKEITLKENITSSYKLKEYLQKETGYSINYSESVLKISKNIKLQHKKATFKHFLDKIFEQQQVTYIVKPQKILVKPKTSNKSSKTSLGKEHFINIKGRVTEKQTKKPIAYATISIKNKAIGTVTNTEGAFVFHIPKKYKNNSLVISSIGYKSYAIKISDIKNNKLNIQLEKKVYDLSEVDVKPKNALEIVKQAIAKIPENYPTKDIQLNTFVRNILNEHGKFVRLTEAACLINYSAYNINIDKYQNEKNYYESINIPRNYDGKELANWYDNYVAKNDQAKIVELRTSKNQSTLLNSYYMVGGPLNILSADKVKFRNDFMDGNYFKFYKYELQSISNLNGKKVYVVRFEPKNRRKDHNPGYRKNVYKRKFVKAPFKGKIYIEIESLAFVRFKYSLANSYAYKSAYKHIKYDIQINYKKTNNEWNIYQIQRKDKHIEISKGRNKQQIIDTVTAYSQILVNDILRKNPVLFDETEVFPHSISKALFEFPSNYNKEFWKNYNTIVPTELEQKIIADLSEKESLSNQFETSQIRDTTLKPPIAKRILKCDTLPFEIVCNNYSWMKDYSSKGAIQYLVNENKYADNFMRPSRNLQVKLIKEMLDNSFKEDDIRYKKYGNYYYYERYYKNSAYQLLCRKKNSLSGKEEILIDFNEQGNKYPYFSADAYDISPDNSTISYLIDKTGDETYTAIFYDINNNCDLIDSLHNIFQQEWIDTNSILYTKDNETGNTKTILFHKIGDNQQNDQLIFESKDDIDFFIGTDRNKEHLLIYKVRQNESEISFININDFTKRNFKIISAFRKNHFYTVQIINDKIYILSNKNMANKQIFVTKLNSTNENFWKVLYPNIQNELITEFYVLKDYLILKIMQNGIDKIKIFNYKTGKSSIIEFDEPCAIKIIKLNFNKLTFEFNYSNLKIPLQKYVYDLTKLKYTKKYEFENPTTYDSGNYKLERIWVNSSDGIKIPVTLFYKKRTGNVSNHKNKIIESLITDSYKLKGKNKMLLTAYGSSGTNFNMSYDPTIIPLVNRGFIYAVAHVRGGSELGMEWYDAGTKLNKRNTYNDFIDCAKYLIKEDYTTKDKLIIQGGSAGGTLIGYAINNYPELFKAAILKVPLLDIIGAANDTTYRLNSHIIHELGNPNIPKEYNYMKSYSPYQNISNKKYPNILLLSGYLDKRVRPWESAMYIAKLRSKNKSQNIVLFKTLFNAGHVGMSGQNSSYKDKAYAYSFIIETLKQN